MRRDRGDRGFRRISWEEALSLAGKKIRASDPDGFNLYLTSRGITNEVYYVAQKVARFLGSPHVENSARLCHSPSTAGMKSAIGYAASTVSYKDWIGSDLMVFFGSTCQRSARGDQVRRSRQEKGRAILAVNSYREPGLEKVPAIPRPPGAPSSGPSWSTASTRSTRAATSRSSAGS